MSELHNSFNVFMQTLNVDEVFQVRVNSRMFNFTQTWENNTKSHKQKRNMTPFSWIDLTFEWYEDHMVFCYCSYFCLEPAVRKDTWMRTTSVTVMELFSKVAFWKLLDHSYVQSSFPIITRHIENSIWKATLQLNIFRTWINFRATSFIKTSVNM